MKELEEIHMLVKAIPNDARLGDIIRGYINKLDTNKNNFVLCIKCGTWQSILNHKCKKCNE